MFGSSRRHRPPVQPLTRETANPNAATAAASAFMRRDPSSTPSLSSAAAAAALKARPMTPTNVAEVQSRRSVRRSPSVSSTASRDRGRRDLQRSPSVGSMTERSFRSPSPGPSRGQAPLPQDVPPVPQLPRDDKLAGSANGSAQRKTQTIQTQNFRTASQKMKDGQQSSWFGAAASGDPNNVRKSDAAMQRAYSPTAARPGSISPSINFSYPRKSESPEEHDSSTHATEPHMVYDANSRRMVPKVAKVDLLEREASVRDAAEKPVKRKKKQDLARSGSHLSKGTVGRTRAPGLDTTNVAYTHPQPEAEPVAAPVREPDQPGQPPSEVLAALRPRIESPAVAEPPHVEPGVDEAAVTSVEQPQALPSASAPAPAQDEAGPVSASKHAEATNTSREQDVAEKDAAEPSQTLPQVGIEQQQTEPQTETKNLVGEQPKTEDVQERSRASRARVHSESPARTAHFAPASDQLVVMHEPPPRSVSPRKSALKYRSPTRGVSPSDDSSETSVPVSGVNSKDDSDVPRKKSVRVSFDDQNTVVVGESARPMETDSPVLPSPQASKKPWHNLVGRYNRKDAISLDEDETMAPRPALPAFGSVREKKIREPEERPLVRPSERIWSPPPASSLLRQTSLAEEDSASASPPGDSALRNEANISKYREPLPPVVTSIEGNDYINNSEPSSEDEMDTQQTNLTLATQVTQDTVDEAMEDFQTPQTEVATADLSLPVENGKTTQNEKTAADGSGSSRNIPDIAVSEPTPLREEHQPEEPRTDFFDIPGGFPSEDEDSTEASTQASNTTDKIKSSVQPPAPTAGQQSLPAEVVPDQTRSPALDSTVDTTPTIVSTPMADIEEMEESGDNSSIYSDAYEDLSETEGDGFMSLDTVLAKSNSPPSSKTLQKIPEINTKIKHMASQRSPALDASPTTPRSEKSLSTPSDWEKAKAYWKSLSPEERRRLEKELGQETTDAGMEADAEREKKPKKRTKKSAANGAAVHGASDEPSKAKHRVYQIQPGTKWTDDQSQSSPVERTGPSDAQVTGTGSKLRKSALKQESGHNTVPAQTGMMRKSMRSGDQGSTSVSGSHFHTSMRSETEPIMAGSGGFRKSMRSGEPVGRAKQAGRPVSYQPPASTEPVRSNRRPMSADGRQLAQASSFGAAFKSASARRGSDASESSFTRERAGGEGFGFKKSMRGSMREAPSEPAKASSRFSLRSLSPTGSNLGRSSTPTASPSAGGRMRQSLRSQSTDSAANRLRMPTFGRSSGKKTKKKAEGGSRFADSSDEEGGPSHFRSRFADSSDEEDAPVPQPTRTTRPRSSSAAAAAAVGALPMQREEVESPDLPDSDDEIHQPKRGGGLTNGAARDKSGSNLQRSGSGRGNLANGPGTISLGTQATNSSRPQGARRGSFMSTVLRRKADSGNKISRNVGESAARKDTKLERSTEELTVIRSNSNNKLQRRAPSWPLQDAPALAEIQPNGHPPKSNVDGARPSTAVDGGPASKRPGFLQRRSTSQGMVSPISPIQEQEADAAFEDTASEPAHKKKRFSTLRKMFRLHD